MTMSAAVRVLAGAVVAITMMGCSVSASVGFSNLDTAALEDALRDEIGKTIPGEITVSCPEDVAMEQGADFQCTARHEDGSTLQVAVTQEDDEGNVNWQLVEG